MQTYFDQVDRVRFAGPITDNPLAFRHYNPDEICLLYTSPSPRD